MIDRELGSNKCCGFDSPLGCCLCTFEWWPLNAQSVIANVFYEIFSHYPNLAFPSGKSPICWTENTACVFLFFCQLLAVHASCFRPWVYNFRGAFSLSDNIFVSTWMAADRKPTGHSFLHPREIDMLYAKPLLEQRLRAVGLPVQPGIPGCSSTSASGKEHEGNLLHSLSSCMAPTLHIPMGSR